MPTSSTSPLSITLATFTTLLTHYQPLITTLSLSGSRTSTSTSTPPPPSTPLTSNLALLPTSQQSTLPLSHLDTYRRTTLPTLLTTRSPPHLTGAELLLLTRWKLKHGKFRPTLLSLVASNPSKAVEAVTQEAYSVLSAAGDDDTAGGRLKWETVDRAIGVLCKGLRGVGPATATAILSVGGAVGTREVPFFGDEAFAWLVGGDAGDGKPTKLKMKYDRREYRDFYERVDAIRARLGVDAAEVERVGFVLGRGGASLGQVEVGDGVRAGGEEAKEERERKAGSGEATEADAKLRVKISPPAGKRRREERIGMNDGSEGREADEGKSTADEVSGLRRSKRRK